MAGVRIVRYGIGLGVGCFAAFLAAPFVRQALAGGEDHEHGPTRVVQAGTSLHGALSGLVESLEEGTVTLGRIASATQILIPCIRPETGDPGTEQHFGLDYEGSYIGDLRIPASLEDGRRDWIFELVLPPLPRYGAMGGDTNLAITLSGKDGTIHFASALAQTHVHVSKAVIADVEKDPILIGGCYRVDEDSTKWNSFVLDVKVPPETGIPLWTNRMGKEEWREIESLRTDGIDVVAAALFAL